MRKTLPLQLFNLQLILAETIERVYVRDKLGRFAENEDFQTKQRELLREKLKEAATKKVVSADPTGLIRTAEDIKREQEFVQNLKDIKGNTYKAFGIKNSAVFENAVKTGLSAPSPLQNVLFSTVKVPASSLGINVEASPEEIEKQVKEVYKEHENDAIVVAGTTLGRSYLKHQYTMDKFRHLEDYGETEWVGQMGRMGAFAVDLAWDATTIMGAAALPAVFGGAATLEVMAPAVQQGIEKKVVLPLLVKDVYQGSEKALGGEKPENVLLGLAVGATVGGAINDAARIAKEHPESVEKVASLANELSEAAPRVEDFAKNVNKAMDETGAKDLFEKPDLNVDDFMTGAKEVYAALPKQDQEIVKTLTTGALS